MDRLLEIIEKIKDILAKEIGDKKVFDKDVAKALKLSPAAFATMKNRGKIPYEEVIEFCVKHKISVNWLLYGQDPSTVIESTNRFAYVRYFSNVNASAGGGAPNEDELGDSLMIDESLLDKLGMFVSPKDLEAINVVGDSMEPTLSEGDVLFIDVTNKDIDKDGVFVVGSNHGVFVKRILKRVDGNIDIISDNLDYSTQTMSPEEMTIVGKAIGVFGRVH